MLSTATPLEIAYTTAMAFALVTTVVNLWWAQARINELKRMNTNGIVLALRTSARNDQLVLMFVCSCLVAIGAIALEVPSNPGLPGVATIISGVAFIGMSVAILVLSVMIRLRPRHLRDIAAHERQHADV